MSHRFPQRVICRGARCRTALTSPDMPHALPDDTAVVGLLVVAFNSRENLLRCFRRNVQAKLVGSREQERNEGLLVVGHDGQDIEANAFRKRRLMQESIALHFRECFGNALHRNGLQFEMHRTSYFLECPKTRNSFDSGSKKRSTTRSLSGMMALSVIVMPSGHTLVQHLVILHNPTPNCVFRSGTRSATSSGGISRGGAEE